MSCAPDQKRFEHPARRSCGLTLCWRGSGTTRNAGLRRPGRFAGYGENFTVTPVDTSQNPHEVHGYWLGLLLGHYSAKGPISRILFYAIIPLGATLPSTLISDLPGGFDSPKGARVNRLNASGRCATPRVHSRAFPSLFGLAPCGVYPASVITAGAVRSYRTFSPLPDCSCQSRNGLAVSSLWHWPSTGLEARIPDVIRHTTLRSSDFPPPATRQCRPPAATARSFCQRLVYPESLMCHADNP